MIDRLVKEALTSKDCYECSRNCCVYLFTEAGPKLQSYEKNRVLTAILNAREEIVNERAGERFELLTKTIMNEGVIPPLPIVIDGFPENVCGVYSLSRKECLIYGDRPESCRHYPVYVDGKSIVWIDKACPAHEKTRDRLEVHGISAKLDDFLKTNLEIKKKPDSL